MQATLAEKQRRISTSVITSTAEPASTQWITAAAERIGVAVEFIYDACASGGLRHVRLNSRRSIRIKPGWLDEWMSQFVVENR